MDRSKPRELYRMPLNTDEWRKMTALHTLEEKGALLEACLVAWAAPLRGNPPATLPDDEDQLETLFGRKWGKVQPVIRQHFRPCAETPGSLRCAWLLVWYEDAYARYMARAIAGQKGGKKRAKRTSEQPPLFAENSSWASSPATSSATAGLQAGLKQLKPNVVITTHNGASHTRDGEDQEPHHARPLRRDRTEPAAYEQLAGALEEPAPGPPDAL